MGFRVKHLDLAYVIGRFVDFQGSISFDPKNIIESKTSAIIRTKSIFTSNEERDKHLLSDDFFNSKEFSQILFITKRVIPIDEQNFKVVGDLTLLDKTKPVSLAVKFGGIRKDLQDKKPIGFSATTALKRSDFGMDWHQVTEDGSSVISDEVEIFLEIEGIEQPYE